MNRQNKTLITLIILLVIYLIVSITYSYFTAIITGVEEDTTITLDSGKLEIDYDGGPDITANNIYPDDEPFAEKEFTVKGTNTVSEKYPTLDYSVNLVIQTNTFTSDALSFTLEGSGSNGKVASKDNTPIKTGASNIFISNAFFEGNVNNETHTYTLKIYFLETGENQSVDMNKSFGAYVVIDDKYEFNNAPQLTEGMTPIKFNGLSEVNTTEDDDEWYDYENKLWANAKTADGSYWVWIPRYAYKIASCYHMDAAACESETGKEAGEIGILFLDGKTNKTFDGTEVSLSPSHSGNTQTNFVKHPAFTFGDSEIEGFWIGKFEPSGTSSNISVKPNVASLRSMTIGDQFTAALNLKEDTKFGWNSSKVDTHMLKNIEWGAVTYLSQSIYGANEEVYINNSSSYTTGCAGDTVSAVSQSGCANAWNTESGTKASTTHNITGVYDMSGGGFENVAAYYSESTSNSLIYNGQLLDSHDAYPNKYVDAYTNPYNELNYGDAMYETSSSGYGSDSWYKDNSYSMDSSSPFLLRGGGYVSGSNAGLFGFNGSTGDSNVYRSFRAAVALLP